MICEKCGETCYLIDVELTISMFGLLSGVQGLKKKFKCIKCGTEIEEQCGTEIEEPRKRKKAEGSFVKEGESLVWKPGKRGEEPAKGVR